MIPMRSRCAVFPLILGLWACGTEAANGPPSEIRIADGPSKVGEWSAVEELRLGRIDGGGPEVFGEVIAFDVAESGTIYILDKIAQEVRAFSPSGDFLLTLGRKGEGPGELLGGGGVSIGPNGWIWIWDVKNNRYTAFDSLGRTQRTIRREPVGIIVPWRGGFGADNFIYDFSPKFIGSGPIVRYFGERVEFRPYRVDPGTGEVEWLTPFREELDLTDGGFPRPLSGRLTFARDRSGFLWLAHTSEYRLFKTDFSGDTVLTVVGESKSIPLDPQDVDSVLAVRWGTEGRRIEKSELPRSGPVLRRILVANDGRVFVERRLRGGGKGTQFEVLSPSGSLIARLNTGRTLAKVPRPKIIGDWVYGVVNGDFDEDYFVRLRILMRPKEDSLPSP